MKIGIYWGVLGRRFLFFIGYLLFVGSMCVWGASIFVMMVYFLSVPMGAFTGTEDHFILYPDFLTNWGILFLVSIPTMFLGILGINIKTELKEEEE